MRRLLPTVRSFLSHSGHVVGLAATAALVMAFAPLTPTEPAASEPFAVPEAPPVTAVAEAAGPVLRQMTFSVPVPGYAVNSPFGVRQLPGEAAPRRHEGVDIAAPQGASVYVAAEGVVLRTGYDPEGYGRFIEVRHPNGMTTLYGHLSRIDVASGMAVAPGGRIGLVGTTGRSTGPHLHFEVRRNGGQVNPVRVLGRTFDVAVRDTIAT